MDKYFTFCLCSTRWKSLRSPLSFTKWLVGRVQPSSALTIIGRGESDYNQLEPSIKGNYLDYERSLEELSFDSLRIANRRFSVEGTELHLCFEKVHRTYVYGEGTLLDGSARLRALPLERGVKIFTFSVRLDLWSKADLALEIFERVEKLFVELGCVYAYGNPTPHVITGSTSLIWGNSHPGYPRIVDFDYNRQIERVCRANYLSETLLQMLEPQPPKIAGVRFVDLRDGEHLVGTAIYVDDCGSEQICALEEYVSPILWTPMDRNSDRGDAHVRA